MKTIFSSLVIFALCLTQANAEPESNRHLKVAAVLGLTGSAAYHSQGIRQGLELAKEELEHSGWVIDLQYEDDHTDPSKTVSAFQFLTSQKYSFFVGPTWSFQANAVRPLLDSHSIIALVPAGSSEINGGKASGMFNLCPSRQQQVPYVTSWLKEKGYRRAYILTANGDWGAVHDTVFRHAVENAGGEVVGEDHFDYGIDVPAAQTLLLKVRRAKADLVMTTGGSADIANLVRAKNISKLQVGVLSTDDVRDAVQQRLLDKPALNNVYAVGLTVSPVFIKRYKNKFGDDPSLYSDRGYDALLLLADAVEKTDGSVQQVRDYLQSKTAYQGVIGPITFDENGDVKSGQYQVTSVFD